MRRDPGDVPTTRPGGPGGWIRGIIDRSIAMYRFRRLSGRRRAPGLPPESTAILSADEAAHRIGAAEARPARPVISGTAALTLASVGRSLTGARRPRATPELTARRRLVYDAAITVAGLAVVTLVAVALWPRQQGGVLGVTGVPASDLAIAPPASSEGRPPPRSSSRRRPPGWRRHHGRRP